LFACLIEGLLMDYLHIIVVVTAAAVVVQIGVLVALLVTVQKSTSRMSALASDVKDRVMPLSGSTKALLAELKAKTTSIESDVTTITNLIRNQVKRVDAAVGEITATSRLQVVRGREVFNHTRSRIDETRTSIHRTVTPFLVLSRVFRLNPLSLLLMAIANEKRGASAPPKVPF
jgi:hypothetical protein